VRLEAEIRSLSGAWCSRDCASPLEGAEAQVVTEAVAGVIGVKLPVVRKASYEKKQASAGVPGLRRTGVSCYDFSLRRFCSYSASSARANNSSIEQGLVGSKRATPTLKANA